MESTPIEKVLAALPNAKRKGDSWTACCPAHDDHHPSLSISQGDDGRALVYCHSGCEQTAVIKALDLSASDLMPDNNYSSSYAVRKKPPKRKQKQKTTKDDKPTYKTAEQAIASYNGRQTGQWEYTDGQGEPMGYVLRLPKPDGDKIYQQISRVPGGWQTVGMPEPQPLYQLPELADADLVFICEGEKAADAVREIGLTATTSAGGSNAPHKADWHALAGKTVCILPDNDDMGEKYQAKVCDLLAKVEPQPVVSVVQLPGLPVKGDAVEYIAGMKAEGQSGEDIKADLLRWSKTGIVDLDDCGDDTDPPVAFAFHTAAEFDALDLRRDYHIPGILAAGPHGALTGSFKTLKTSVGMDMLLSLASGKPFLNHFPVNQTRVGVMSGESGGFALQNLARRVAASKGISLASVGDAFRVSMAVPKLSDDEHLEEIERFIVENKIGLFTIDPAYLAMSGMRSDAAGNLFEVGAQLAPLGHIGQRTGCTMIVIHHNSRGATKANAGEPAELADIAWSGFSEWAGQWLLLARRERYDPDSNGEHRLWLTAGGRDGHSTLVGVNVTEGKQDNPGGRQWTVEVEQAAEARHESVLVEQERREQQRKAKHEKQLTTDRATIIATMQQLPDGETKTAIKSRTGIRTERFDVAFADLLLNESIIEGGKVRKGNNREYDTFQIASSRNESHQVASSR